MKNVIENSHFLFLGHFGDEYPWHTETLTALVNKLETLSQPLDKDAKITLRNRKFICDLKSDYFYKMLYYSLIYFLELHTTFS